nr:transcription factor EMB1444-like isoform X2 [Lolium perenne]
MRLSCGRMGLNKELLQGLCSDGLWKYAVFWSLESENGILTWGDGYVDKMTKDTQRRDLYDNLADSDNQIISHIWSNNDQYQSYPLCPVLCPIEAALLSMFCHSYSLGEEIIGKVAVTGQHCWISANDFRSTLVYKYHEDWQFQFAAGIKTVLLVPVIPHGVLHLGSLHMVLESSALVTLVKDLFYKINDPSILHNPSATGFVSLKKPTASLLADPPDTLAHDLFDLINSSAQLLRVDHLNLSHPFTASEFPMVDDVIAGAYVTGITACPDETSDANESDLWTSAHEGPSELTHCKTLFEQDMTNPNSKLSCRPVTNMEDSDYNNIDGFTLAYMAQEYQENTHGTTTVLNDDFVTSNSLVHSKLHKDVEAMPREDLENFVWHSRSKHQEFTSHSLLQANESRTCFYSHLENNEYAEFLLDAITCQVGSIPNSVSSQSTGSLTSSQTQIQREDHAVRLEELSVPNHPGGQDFSPISVNDGFMSYKVTVSSPAEINKTMTEECMGRTIQDVRGDSVKIKHGCRKTELQKARPRDRQLIQDRMKELRELIPNATKCSIDALLDSTITHMVFLQSVSEKAERDKIGNRELQANKNLENCPLRVQELEQSGHLLIEMVCKGYDVFFEIAHLFKNLEVSILKGELEYRSDELWACFVIEASECSNKMQILCPLMHLLQRR